MKIKYSKRGLTFSFQENETFKVGTRYRYLVDATNSEVILLPDENGKYKFSRKGINKPLVGLRNEEIREVMSMARFMEVEIQDDKIIVHIIKTDVNIDTLTAHQLTDLLEKSELISFSIDKEILQENNAALREMLQVGGFFSEQSRNDISYVFDVVSLFSGAGLLDLPFKKDSSFDIKFAVDFDKAACETYKKNLGDHILCMDIRNLKEEDVPECELIMGGVCCQGYSNANRAGNATLDLSKRLLVDDYIRIVRAKSPLMFVIENVPQFITKENGKYLSKVIEGLSDKYNITYSVVNDWDLGGYSTRKRMILIGSVKAMGKVIIPDVELFSKKTVKPHTTKVACFQICKQIRERWRCHFSLIFLHNPSLGGWTAFLPYSLNSEAHAVNSISSALRLTKVENVQVLLLVA